MTLPQAKATAAEHPGGRVDASEVQPGLRRSAAGDPPGGWRQPPGSGDRGGPQGSMSVWPVVSNARLAMVIFLGAEAMLFAGLISAFLVFRFGNGMWPPLGQPLLPIGVTLINTAILLSSAFTMRRARQAIAKGQRSKFLQSLLLTVILGSTFLAIQGSEWGRLIKFGLTLSAGVYGSTFYTLIGMHAAHVTAAVLWLLVVLWRGRVGAFSANRHTVVELCSMYWYFVVAVWPILFVLVYPRWGSG